MLKNVSIPENKDGIRKTLCMNSVQNIILMTKRCEDGFEKWILDKEMILTFPFKNHFFILCLKG